MNAATKFRLERRAEEARLIRVAYQNAEAALGRVGTLLRTTHAGEYLWSAEHKTAVAGLRVVIRKLENSVPNYYTDDDAAD